MIDLPAIRRFVSPPSSLSTSVVGIGAIGAFWLLLSLAALLQPGYEPTRDTISSLASEGATQAWVGLLAISTGGFATVVASFTLRKLSQPAALALGIAGVTLVAVALTRIACFEGAAGCAMSDATEPSTALGHTIAIVLYEVTFVGGICSAALCLWRAGARIAAMAALVGVVASILFFAIVPLETGLTQRLWLPVNTVLVCGALFPSFHLAGRGRPPYRPTEERRPASPRRPPADSAPRRKLAGDPVAPCVDTAR